MGSSDGRDGSIVIHQDIELFASILDSGEQAAHAFKKGRKGWLRVVRGSVEANKQPFLAGNGAAMQDELNLALNSQADGTEVLLFDLP